MWATSLGRLSLRPPSGKWHLSEKPDERDLIYRTDGSDRHRRLSAAVSGPGGPSKLISQRDVGQLLNRLAEDEMLERTILPAFLEFLKRGGTIGTLDTFKRVRGDQARLGSSPLLPTVDELNMAALVQLGQKWNGQAILFSLAVGDLP